MKPEKVAELKDRLKEAMVDKKIKPIELSRRTNVGKSMVSYYMAGKSIPKGDRIYLFAQVLGVNEAWLMGYDVPKERTMSQKKNDQLARVIQKLRTDAEFFDLVCTASELSAAERASIAQVVSALRHKQLED